jgi:uncharacterized surface protein with fasciclin (FAS1) repeats
MKVVRSIKFSSFLFITILFLASCDDDDNDNIIPSNNTAFNFIANNDNFSSLELALQLTSLDATLKETGEFTVFAPTNAAFTVFLNDTGFTTLQDVPVGLLRETLLYHILTTEIETSTLSNGYIKSSANNSIGEALDLYVETDAQIKLNAINLDINNIDNQVDNGIVHVLDGVLRLPTITDLLSFNSLFSNLNTALVQTSLDETLDLRVAPAPFTLFAPSNDAFTALIDADPADSLDNIGDVLALPNLSDILQFHVIAGAAIREGDIVDGGLVDPITTGNYIINSSANPAEISVNGTFVARLVNTDVTALNGVIHTIDFVLIP